MPSFKVYDSRAISLVLVGISITDGLADPFIKIAPRGDAYEDDIGVDGEVCRFPTNECRYDVEVTLKGYSSHNQQLADILAVDRVSTGGAGVGVFLLKDENGATIHAGDKCWLVGSAPQEFGKNKPDCTWKLTVLMKPYATIVGGN
jgi:hypothetical protein